MTSSAAAAENVEWALAACATGAVGSEGVLLSEMSLADILVEASVELTPEEEDLCFSGVRPERFGPEPDLG